MPILGHITEEASRSIAIAMVILLTAALTILIFLIWAIIWFVRSRKKRRYEEYKSNQDHTPGTES